ncbi:MAG: hypothetical protein B7733_17010 [Myxococcales bacterium FL481]|nr:MAG: hypothetical protein B7733_17010 [Myxococcales bacterium FL481]
METSTQPPKSPAAIITTAVLLIVFAPMLWACAKMLWWAIAHSWGLAVPADSPTAAGSGVLNIWLSALGLL